MVVASPGAPLCGLSLLTAHISNNDLQRKMNLNTRKGRGRVAACRQAMKAERDMKTRLLVSSALEKQEPSGKSTENERVEVRRISEGAL